MILQASTTTHRRRRNALRIFWLESKYEFLKNLRLPIYSLSVLMFPVMFYVLFGLSFGRSDFGPVSSSLYYAVTYSAFGIMGASLFGFGVNVAVERGQGWMHLKRAFPMPPLAYFAAKVFMATLFGLIIVLTLLTLGTLFGGMRLAAGQILVIVGVLIAGALPFSALGLALGYLTGPNSATAVVNLIYLPMSFSAGLWIPIQELPAFFQTLAPYLPSYHYAQLGLASIGAGDGGHVGWHILVLTGITLVSLLVALVLYFRDEARSYG
ncbi:MAG: ABC transporter permease [Trueperaceae bacterium]|nr:MAG: ABC transporter permease [Trueperaceae bacterium]